MSYTKYIPAELARKLLTFGMQLYKYDINTYDCKPCIDVPMMGEMNWENGDRYRIPTYGEVFDWFFTDKKIAIILIPFFTMSLKEQMAYTWEISFPSKFETRLITITENEVHSNTNGYGGSFSLTANDAIEYAMTIK